MPEDVTCPHCDKRLRIPEDKLGKRVKCPSCGEPFEAAPAKPDFEVLDEEESPAKPLKRKKSRVKTKEQPKIPAQLGAMFAVIAAVLFNVLYEKKGPGFDFLMLLYSGVAGGVGALAGFGIGAMIESLMGKKKKPTDEEE